MVGLAALTGCASESSDEHVKAVAENSVTLPAAQPQSPAPQQQAAPNQVAANPAVPAQVAPVAAAPARDPLAGAFFTSIPQTRIQVPVPAGWKKVPSGGLYTMIQSPNDEALFLFTTVSTKGELAGRRQHIEKIARISNLRQVGEKTGTIGPSQLRATIEAFEGNFHGVPGDMQILYIDQGTGSRNLVVAYVVSEKKGDPFVEQQFGAVFANIRRN